MDGCNKQETGQRSVLLRVNNPSKHRWVATLFQPRVLDLSVTDTLIGPLISCYQSIVARLVSYRHTAKRGSLNVLPHILSALFAASPRLSP